MARLVSDDAWGIMTVWQEARNQSYKGMVMVAEVILRRVRLKYMSDGTITGTILHPYQFSGWNTKDPNRILASVIDVDDQMVIQCMNAWEAAKNGSNYSNGAVIYFNPRTATSKPAGADVFCVAEQDHQFWKPATMR